MLDLGALKFVSCSGLKPALPHLIMRVSISVRDVVELLDYYLPRRERTAAAVQAALTRRHQARQKTIDFTRTKQKSSDGLLTK